MASLDRTWCDFWRDCAKSAQCTRKLTEDVRDRAAIKEGSLNLRIFCSEENS